MKSRFIRLALLLFGVSQLLSASGCMKHSHSFIGTWNALALEEFGRDKLGENTAYFQFGRKGELTFVIQEDQRINKGSWKIKKGNKMEILFDNMPDHPFEGMYKLSGDTLSVRGHNGTEELYFLLIKDR